MKAEILTLPAQSNSIQASIKLSTGQFLRIGYIWKPIQSCLLYWWCDNFMCLLIFQAILATVKFLWKGTRYLDSTGIHKTPWTHNRHISHHETHRAQYCAWSCQVDPETHREPDNRLCLSRLSIYSSCDRILNNGDIF